MLIRNIRYGRMVFMMVVTILILFLFLLAQFSLRASGGKGFIDQAKEHFHHWFQKTVFKHNWEDIHCRPRQNNESVVEESWIPELALQLNLQDGTSVFDSNTGCNEWLKLLRKKYHDLRIGGAHLDQYAVDYAKRLFNDTPSTFGTISREGKLEFFDDHIHPFAHVINYGGLQKMKDEGSICNLVRELLRIVLPGGSLYLGHNFDRNDCRVLEKFASVSKAGCYWSEECLKNRTDIAYMYYIKEKDLFGSHSQMDDCHIAVFIHKKIGVSGEKDMLDKQKYVSHKKMHYCIKNGEEVRGIAGQVDGLGRNMVDLSHVILQGHSIGKGYKMAKKLYEMSNAPNNTSGSNDYNS